MFTLQLLLVLALAALGAWGLRLRSVSATTAVLPWHVSLAAVGLLLASEGLVVLAAPDGASWVRPLRFAAAVGLFCPAMALLGAKRPQDRAWLLIVLSLWVILALPAFELILLGRGDDLDLQDVRAWFLWGLILLEVGHRAATRTWPAALAQAAAQLILLAPYLPLIRSTPAEPLRLIGLALPVLAMILLSIAAVRERRGAQGYTREWLEFRDVFGVLWALRVAERVNAAAQMYGWPLRLNWTGFERTDEQPWSDDAAPPQLHQTFHSLLRRFVAEEQSSRRD